MRTCFDCGQAVEIDVLVCPYCSGVDLTKGFAAPDPAKVTAFADELELPFPLDMALERVRSASVVALYGPPGSGKTAILSLLEPDLWATSEQTVGQATASISWAQGGLRERIPIHEVASPADVEDLLGTLHEGVLVVDSLTRLGSYHAQVEALESIEKWAQAEPRRLAFVVLQVNAEGQPAGLTASEHLTTAILSIAVDDEGIRRLSATKNRDGPLGQAYFTLTGKGVEPPALPYSYSVEGKAGRYRLHPFPLPKAKWAEVLGHYFDAELGGQLRPGLAHAGVIAWGYDGNQVSPADVEARKRFALSHGLEWLDYEPEPEAEPEPAEEEV